MVYAFALWMGAGALLALLILDGFSIGNEWVIVVLATLAAAAEKSSIRFSPLVEVSIALVPTLFAAVLFGPLAAMAVAAASMLGDIRSSPDQPLLKWAIYTGTRAITGGLTGLVAVAIEGLVGSPLAGVALATAGAAVTAEVLDTAFAAIVHRLRGAGDNILQAFIGYGPLAIASASFYAPIVAVLVVAYREVSPWTLALFLVPAVAAQRLYVLYHGQRELTADVLKANLQLERANLSFATALVATLEARDRYTAGHSASVAAYARDIAKRMGLPEEQQRLAHVCGLVHDIGKVGLLAGLLEKRGPLTLSERRQMETHTLIGERILSNVEDYAEIAKVVRHHHERVDGQGYPDGLRGEEIPLVSRIIAVADAYDAMTSDRPYRDAMPSRVARLRLAQAVESQFDTSVVAAFEAILVAASEEYRDGKATTFSQEAASAGFSLSAAGLP